MRPGRGDPELDRELLHQATDAAKIGASSPVVDPAVVTIIAGDDHAAEDGRALDFLDSAWPDLTGSTITLRADGLNEDGSDLVLAGSPIAANRIRFEPTAAETEACQCPATTRYGVRAALASGRTVTLQSGFFKVAR